MAACSKHGSAAAGPWLAPTDKLEGRLPHRRLHGRDLAAWNLETEVLEILEPHLRCPQVSAQPHMLTALPFQLCRHGLCTRAD